MRLLYVSNGSNFAGAGGMEYHLMDVSSQLKSRGVVIGFAVREGTYIQKELLQGEEYVYLISNTGPKKILSLFQLLTAFFAFNPDIVSINRERDIIQVYFIARLYNLICKKQVKIVSVFHNLWWRRKFNLNKLDGIIFPNRFIRDHYIGTMSEETKISIIYHGLQIERFARKDYVSNTRIRKYFTDACYPIIGMVGEFRKNQIELVDVAFHLRKKMDSFIFAVVGRGTDKEIAVIIDRIKALNLEDHFVVTGNVDRSSIPDVFYDIDVSVTTNRYEPFGIVFIESLASCTPLIAYNSGGPVEILAEGGGYLVEGGPEEMAETIYRLVTDGERMNRVSAAARTSAEKIFSIEAMGKQHFEFYQEMINS